MIKFDLTDLTIMIGTLLFIIILTFVTLTFFVPEKYRLISDCKNCSIGKVEIAGDYICNQSNLNPLSYNCRDLAIEDCRIFNEYQRLSKKDERCFV